jgi:hypothetical protein
VIGGEFFWGSNGHIAPPLPAAGVWIWEKKYEAVVRVCFAVEGVGSLEAPPPRAARAASPGIAVDFTEGLA